MISRLVRKLMALFSFTLLMGSTMPVGVSADHPARVIPEAGTVRERFLKLIDRPGVPLNPREKASTEEGGILEQRFEMTSEAGQQVPGIFVKQTVAMTPRPAIIVLHGTGGSKESLRPLLRRLAMRGLVAVAIDARFAGERSGGAKGAAAYHAAISSTWESGKGFPFFYDTVWDILRLVDYLEQREDVDRKRIGAVGFSKGGIELYLAAAADPRIAAVAPCIGVQSFGWALENNAWQSRVSTIQPAIDFAARKSGVAQIDASFVSRFYDRVVPGIYREFDGPVMLPLIAPRPLLVINGDRDDRTPMPGLEICINVAKKAYQEAGSSDKFEFILQPDTGHAITPQSEQYLVDWLTRQFLKVTGNTAQ